MPTPASNPICSCTNCEKIDSLTSQGLTVSFGDPSTPYETNALSPHAYVIVAVDLPVSLAHPAPHTNPANTTDLHDLDGLILSARAELERRLETCSWANPTGEPAKGTIRMRFWVRTHAQTAALVFEDLLEQMADVVVAVESRKRVAEDIRLRSVLNVKIEEVDGEMEVSISLYELV